MHFKIAWFGWVDVEPLINFGEGCDLELLKEVGLREKFPKLVHCSEFIWVEGDPRLAKYKGKAFPGTRHGGLAGWFIRPLARLGEWIWKVVRWDRYAVLVPSGDPETRFVVGYYDDHLDECRAFPRTRRVKDGPYQMRIPPDCVGFFIVGDRPVGLSKSKEIDARECKRRNLPIPNHDLY